MRTRDVDDRLGILNGRGHAGHDGIAVAVASRKHALRCFPPRPPSELPASGEPDLCPSAQRNSNNKAKPPTERNYYLADSVRMKTLHAVNFVWYPMLQAHRMPWQNLDPVMMEVRAMACNARRRLEDKGCVVESIIFLSVRSAFSTCVCRQGMTSTENEP
ncbi:unnamed protein product [Heligmosomoides polygyrus]|uniref:Uncharacterized protein n=1 Tax=Heligmosomoides polygyrus TaxID=6339 RepID=A0A183G792_HELPZ|nr:unnamed protein product [Heligmosomoides polygyrus]